ncbi:hypothetical protein B4N89_21725 [Embleya scabrispora]|uniref:HTH cro/C1-type domain-containing protein n=1 Tax=Embleya scabrispora TaxID=159449 RepID=A0A1T3P299_9ACTN|nr:helix-turn-helix transcriptional regulator [Embleya scabrispora]OPC83208.1 hypothetical protein B4N89_21725 [Embleya scabrispora]
MGTRVVEIGPTGVMVAHNVERLRVAAGLSQRALAERLTDLGRPTAFTAISKIERAERRVDTDDLVALAVALSVAPTTLLLPPVADGSPTRVTGGGSVTTAEAWEWADGKRPLVRLPEVDGGALAHARRARPLGRRADHLVTGAADTDAGDRPDPLAHLTKQELLALLDNLTEVLRNG